MLQKIVEYAEKITGKPVEVTVRDDGAKILVIDDGKPNKLFCIWFSETLTDEELRRTIANIQKEVTG